MQISLWLSFSLGNRTDLRLRFPRNVFDAFSLAHHSLDLSLCSVRVCLRVSAGLFVCLSHGGAYLEHSCSSSSSILGLWAGSIRQVTTGFCSPSPFSFLGVRACARFSALEHSELLAGFVRSQHDSARPPPSPPSFSLFSFPRAISLAQSRLLAQNVRSQNRNLLAFPLSCAIFLGQSRLQDPYVRPQ